MKVLYFHQHFTTPDGSGGTRSYEFAKNLISKGHEVTMVCGSYQGGTTGLTSEFKKNSRSGYVQGIRVIELNIPYSNKDNLIYRSIKFIHYSIKSLFIVYKNDFDLLFATSTPLTAAIPGIFSKLIKKGKFVFEVRDLWPELPKAMGVIKNPLILYLLDILETIAYKSADGLIGLSPGIVEGIKKKSGNSKKVVMIPNGSDLDLFNIIQDDQSIEALGSIHESDFIALYAGTHGKANGLLAVAQAAKELDNMKQSNIKIVLIGDGSEKRDLLEYKARNKLENLIFIPPLPKKRLGSWMHRSNLGLQILSNIPEFYYGTSPNKFFDYLSSGLPILVNYPGWLSEIIEKEEIGYFADPKEPDSLVTKIIEACANKDDQSIGKNSLKLANNQFNRKNLFLNFHDFLQEIHHA